NVIKNCDRPFANLTEMAAAMIDRHNAVVKPGDLVYRLGDFTGRRDKRKNGAAVEVILNALHGTQILIKGNHDGDSVTKHPGWAKVADKLEIKVDLGGKHKQKIILNHGAQRVWNQMHRGAWHLHGHSHGNLEDI